MSVNYLMQYAFSGRKDTLLPMSSQKFLLKFGVIFSHVTLNLAFHIIKSLIRKLWLGRVKNGFIFKVLYILTFIRVLNVLAL